MTRHKLLFALFLLLLATNLTTLFSDGARDQALKFVRHVAGQMVNLPMSQTELLELKLEDVQKAYHDLNAKNETLRLATVVLVNATQTLIVAQEVTVAALALLKKQNTLHLETARRFNKVVVDRVKKTALRGSASLAARVAPVAGVAVSLTVLGMDLLDACQILKEANHASVALGEEPVSIDTVCGIRVPSKQEALAKVGW